MRTRTIHQKVAFDTDPETVYEMLMNEKIHAAFTGDAAKISRRVGGKFSAGGTYITGKNLVLEKGKTIMQEWHAADMPEGHITEVRFDFKPAGTAGTLLDFTHTKVPSEQYDAFYRGWIDYYWEPMKRYITAHPERKSRKSS